MATSSVRPLIRTRSGEGRTGRKTWACCLGQMVYREQMPGTKKTLLPDSLSAAIVPSRRRTCRVWRREQAVATGRGSHRGCRWREQGLVLHSKTLHTKSSGGPVGAFESWRRRGQETPRYCRGEATPAVGPEAPAAAGRRRALVTAGAFTVTCSPLCQGRTGHATCQGHPSPPCTRGHPSCPDTISPGRLPTLPLDLGSSPVILSPFL